MKYPLRRQEGFVQILRDACESGTKNINENKFAGTGVYLWHFILSDEEIIIMKTGYMRKGN